MHKKNNKYREVFRKFNTAALKENKLSFKDYIYSLIGNISYSDEGFSKDELTSQRDLTLKFHWGHNHDFGDFKISGRMGDRHIDLFNYFEEYFNITPSFYANKEVLDIGCWTGGTTLMLNGLGSTVHAIEEVNKYAKVVSYLANSFGIDKNTFVSNTSIYQCNNEAFLNKFDIAFFPGVIYHLSDPLLALRIIYNALHKNSVLLLETAGYKSDQVVFKYEGPSVFTFGSEEELNRTGWNWFIPSEKALHSILSDAGFENIKTHWNDETKRIFAIAEKQSFKGICKSGLSIKNIP